MTDRNFYKLFGNSHHQSAIINKMCLRCTTTVPFRPNVGQNQIHININTSLLTSVHSDSLYIVSILIVILIIVWHCLCLGDVGCIPSVPWASRLWSRRPCWPDGDPVITANPFSRPRPGWPDRDLADPSASRPAQLYPGCRCLDVPADPTATRLVRRRTGDPVFPTRPGYHDSDQVIPTATRLTRRHHYQHDILAVRRFSHRDCVPDTRTKSWLCSGRAGRVPAVPRSYDCVPDTLSDTWLCRQYPGVCPLSVTHRLLFPVETKNFGRSFSPVLHSPLVRHVVINPWSRAPIVTNLGVIWLDSHNFLLWPHGRLLSMKSLVRVLPAAAYTFNMVPIYDPGGPNPHGRVWETFPVPVRDFTPRSHYPREAGLPKPDFRSRTLIRRRTHSELGYLPIRLKSTRSYSLNQSVHY